jgi:hypothetical protein
MSKRYCSHCGTPNDPLNETCSKCGKPLNSGLHQQTVRETKFVKASRFQRPAQVSYNDHDDDWDGEIVIPRSSDVVIESPRKLTVAGLKNGDQIPSFRGVDQLPDDIQVSSKSYFHNEKLD